MVGPFLLKSSHPDFPIAHISLEKTCFGNDFIAFDGWNPSRWVLLLEMNQLCPPSCLRVHLGKAGPAQMEDFSFIFTFFICIEALIIYSFGVWFFFLINLFEFAFVFFRMENFVFLCGH